MTEDEIARLLINPIYAIEIAPDLALPHEPLFTEDQWVEANAKMIEELGGEAYLRLLLDVLKGNYVTAPTGTTSSPLGNRAQRRAARRR